MKGPVSEVQPVLESFFLIPNSTNRSVQTYLEHHLSPINLQDPRLTHQYTPKQLKQ